MAITKRPRQGTPITLRAAARKYNLSPSTLSRWAAQGLVTVLALPPSRGYPLILDEVSVARIADLYHQNPGQGKRTITRSSKPISRVIGPLNDDGTSRIRAIGNGNSTAYTEIKKESPCQT